LIQAALDGRIFQLLFVDDSLHFFKANCEQAGIVKNILLL